MHEEFRRAVAHKIGRRLVHARHALQVSLPELSRQTGLSEKHLKIYEAGERAISADDLERIAVALRLPVTHFLETCALCGQD